MAARSKTALARAQLGQMKVDLATVMDIPDDPLGGRTSRLVAMTAMARKWISSSVMTMKQDESFNCDVAMRRQLLAVELKAGLVELRSSRLQRSSKGQRAQQLAENLQLLNENSGLRRENQLLQQELQRVRMEALQKSSSTSQRNPISHALSSRKASATKPQGSTTACEVTETSGDVQEDDGEDDDCDPAFVSLGSRAPPSRPGTSDVQVCAQRKSLQSSHRQTIRAQIDQSLVRGRKCPQTAFGLRSTGPCMTSRPQRPVSAQPFHSKSLTRSADRMALDGDLGNVVHPRARMDEGHNADLQLQPGQIASYEPRSPQRCLSGHAAPSSHGQHCAYTPSANNLSWYALDKDRCGDSLHGKWYKPRRRPTSASGVGAQSSRARQPGIIGATGNA